MWKRFGLERSIIPVCNALSKSMRPSKGEKKKIPIRWMHVILGWWWGVALTPMCCSSSGITSTGRMAGLVCRRLRRTLADKRNMTSRPLPPPKVAIFKTIKNWMYPRVQKLLTYHNKYLMNKMNCKTLAHIAKNDCFCPCTCIPTRRFQWLDEWMNEWIYTSPFLLPHYCFLTRFWVINGLLI